MNKTEIIQKLNLTQHIEGGYFAETHRSLQEMRTQRDGEKRSVLTSIFYLLTDDSPIDYFHKNKSDIVHYFHTGWSITYLILHPNGRLEKQKLGSNLAAGEVLQLVVKGGCWKTAILEEGEYGLLGESVSPGFDFRDMQIADESLLYEFPHLQAEIKPYIQPSYVV
ncbi:cupin domain-containing protein [Spirulina sp. CS-785/01]|uniref:cupin domain-containing protein n=1 Tax=Spirulina sp. CS-785/01 TaxID=3021716 RepID=UPI002330D65B|nr:cupin domain-containing protein [Spirulina sp. CS-785/01]MDB9313803.1 cupin domain-containing protein [Spirulina sp. CS-785/01]